jgi:polar amino acid transport system substrate-binding protein
MGYPCDNDEIRAEFNEFLKIVEADGTLKEMQQRWLEPAVPLDLSTPMPEIDLSDTSNGKVTCAITGANLPFEYTAADGEFRGFDIELLMRYASWAKREIEFVSMDFGSIINYVVTGKADMGGSGISITDERLESVNFTDPVYYDGVTLLVINENASTAAPAEEKNFFVEALQSLETAVERNLITDNRWKLVLNGLAVTMTVAFSAMLLGTILGGGVAYLLTRKNRVSVRMSKLVCGLISGLPSVTLLMVAYYIIFGKVDINNVLIATATFAVIMAVRVGETLTQAISTVDPVEIEAARASGFTATGAFMTVTLPQAVKQALPPYLSHFVNLVKETAIVGYVAIGDLMRASDVIRSRTYDAFFPLLFAALIYLIVTTVFIVIFKMLIKRITN